MVNIVRETTKEQLLEMAIGQLIDFYYTIEAIPGKIQLINVVIKNPYPKQQMFKVYFEDSEGTEHSQELNLVNNKHKEWEYWVNNGSSHT